ncbi:hypothetical protein R1flu_010576 [Riccia fluitans]|uniref:Uncharacterized protein n=1 Tax=Riccia fluitans TaxID=41844 RepID=A0ABD1Z5D1_9MARC
MLRFSSRRSVPQVGKPLAEPSNSPCWCHCKFVVGGKAGEQEWWIDFEPRALGTLINRVSSQKLNSAAVGATSQRTPCPSAKLTPFAGNSMFPDARVGSFDVFAHRFKQDIEYFGRFGHCAVAPDVHGLSIFTRGSVRCPRFGLAGVVHFRDPCRAGPSTLGWPFDAPNRTSVLSNDVPFPF